MESSFDQAYLLLGRRILSNEVRDGKVAPLVSDTRQHKTERDFSVAIDFGTSYTLVSAVDKEGHQYLIPDCHQKTMFRSTIEFLENGKYRIGSASDKAIWNVKRAIGKCDSIRLSQNQFSVVILVAMIIRSAIRNAEEFLSTKVKNIIMGIPVDFTIIQRELIRESVRLAGAGIYRFVQESSAESLLLPNKSKEIVEFDEKYAIIDMGGGTLDISIIDTGDGVCEVIYTNGTQKIGSVDYDDALIDILKTRSQNLQSLDDYQLRVIAEQIKLKFNHMHIVEYDYSYLDCDGNIRNCHFSISREEFESAARDVTESFLKQLTALAEAEEKCGSVQAVYLTGQGTKLYILKECITKTFPSWTIVDTYQENALIRGLSIQNMIFNGAEKYLLMIDSLPSSLYLKFNRIEKLAEDMDDDVIVISSLQNGMEDTIIKASTTIPVHKECFITAETDAQYKKMVSIPLSLFEQKQTGDRTIIIEELIQMTVGNIYCLSIDIDANSTIDIEISTTGLHINKKIDSIVKPTVIYRRRFCATDLY